ncbi:MAG: hypothetical protein P4L51_10025 [Puia sp.]|nr:hypothetical protein [Puia sp.]
MAKGTISLVPAEEEFKNLISQNMISNRERMGLRKPPLAFMEQGVATQSSVLKSETAIEVNIQIIRIFSRMRELLLTHKDILIKLERMEKKMIKQDIWMKKQSSLTRTVPQSLPPRHAS